MTTFAADYSWVPEFRRGHLVNGYCLTLIRGISAREFLERVGAEVDGEYEGFDAFNDADSDFQDDQEFWGDRFFIGAAPAPEIGWTFALEINGGIESQTDALAYASRGTSVITHSAGAAAMNHFSWWENGDLRTRFERPAERTGSSPDALVEVMAQSGLDVTHGQSVSASELFAVAGNVSGIHFTPEVLERAVYLTGVVEAPAEGWQRIVIHSRGADGGSERVEIVNPDDPSGELSERP
ncbi:hypothetical protein GWI34_05535 [Actinomadura sp. DSM 109109]|nr:hypothetical protein [Actinomadura lepetitiana]